MKINIKYGNNLDADSTMTMYAELNRIGEEKQAALDENYVESKKQWKAIYDEGDSYYDSAGIYRKEGMSKEEFEKGNAEIDAGYLQQSADVWSTIAEFEINKAREAYPEELSGLISELQTATDDIFGERLNDTAYLGTPNVHLDFIPEDILNSIDIDKSTRDALAELYEPQVLEAMQKVEQIYKEAGEAVPEEIREGLTEFAAIGALSGDVNAMWEVIGETAESEEYQDALRVIRESGGYLPEQIAGAISDNQYMIDGAVSQAWQNTKSVYNRTFGVGLNLPSAAGKFVSPLVTTGHADGGIFNVPHVAWFAEDGPEAAIPLDGSKNAIDLWTKTGELLGMESLAERFPSIMNYSDNSGMQVSFSPVIQVYGNAPKQDIEDVFESKFEEFKTFMERYTKENARYSFR